VSVYTIEKAMGSLEILIRLYWRGPTQKSELFDDVRPNHQTVAKTLQTLRDLGLVHCQEENSFPYRHLCSLTTAGRKLVETPLYSWPVVLWDGGTGQKNETSRSRLVPSVLASRAG